MRSYHVSTTCQCQWLDGCGCTVSPWLSSDIWEMCKMETRWCIRIRTRWVHYETLHRFGRWVVQRTVLWYGWHLGKISARVRNIPVSHNYLSRRATFYEKVKGLVGPKAGCATTLQQSSHDIHISCLWHNQYLHLFIKGSSSRQVTIWDRNDSDSTHVLISSPNVNHIIGQYSGQPIFKICAEFHNALILSWSWCIILSPFCTSLKFTRQPKWYSASAAIKSLTLVSRTDMIGSHFA